VQLVIPLANLARVETQRKNFSKAKTYLNRSRALQEANAPGHSMIGSIDTMLGDIEKIQGKYQKAKKLYLQSYTIFNKQKSADPSDIAMSLANLGAIEVKLKKYRSAEKYLDHALEIIDKDLKLTDDTTKLAIESLAIVYERTGRKNKAAKLRTKLSRPK